MDPNACLKRIMDAARDNNRDEYVSACEDLAGWLSAGEFKPTIPPDLRYIPGTRTLWSILPPTGADDAWLLVKWDYSGNRHRTYMLSERIGVAS